jgi:mRNA interferase MazF
MTNFRFGDVILIEFPHTDLRGKSKRPALVLYDADDQDVLVARVTTQEYTGESDYRIVEWKKSGLLSESFVRLGKQATIEKRFVARTLGVLDPCDVRKIQEILRRILSL